MNAEQVFQHMALPNPPTHMTGVTQPVGIRIQAGKVAHQKDWGEKGYHVEQNPAAGGGKKPAYRVNGEIFDCYSPKTSRARNLAREVLGKIEEGQTANVVINLADSPVTVNALKTQLNDYPIPGLNKVIIIEKFNNIIPLK